MKRFTSKVALVAVSLFAAVGANAQYITEGGFDLAKGKDYVILYAPTDVVTAMGNKVKSNQNLDATQKKNRIDYWVASWDSRQLSLCNYEETGVKNSFGSDEFKCITPTKIWTDNGTAAFYAITPYDLSMIDDDYILHMGIRNNGAADATYKLQIGPNGSINDNGFQLEIGIPAEKADGNYVGVGSLPRDSKWYGLDIPIKDLTDDDHEFGFEYNFKSPLSGNVVTINVKGTCSTTTQSLPPGATVYDYTVTKLGSALSFDSFFFYKKDNSTNGINEMTHAASNEAQAVYDLSGRRADMSRPGVYVVKTAKGVKKVAVK